MVVGLGLAAGSTEPFRWMLQQTGLALRATLTVTWLLLLSSCNGSEGNGPDPQPYEGIWQLQTMNGQALPATAPAFLGQVRAGVLRLVAGSSRWEWCETLDGGGVDAHPSPIGYLETPAGILIIIYSGTAIPRDTIFLTPPGLTWHYRNGLATPVAVLTLSRHSGVVPTANTPRACDL